MLLCTCCHACACLCCPALLAVETQPACQHACQPPLLPCPVLSPRPTASLHGFWNSGCKTLRLLSVHSAAAPQTIYPATELLQLRYDEVAGETIRRARGKRKACSSGGPGCRLPPVMASACPPSLTCQPFRIPPVQP